MPPGRLAADTLVAMRSRLLLAAGLLVLAGCGQQPTDGGADPSSGGTTAAPGGDGATEPAAPALDRAWLAGFESGDEEVPDRTTYVRFVPATGDTVVTELPHPPFDSEPNPTTLVDADRDWALASNAASREERRAATVRVASLTGAEDRQVDLRAATGVADLHPLGWGFAPTEPGLLRVLDGSGRVFEVPLGDGDARELERLTPGPGQALAPLFDSATGMPLLRDRSSYQPVGGGAYDAAGFTIVDEYDVPQTGTCRDGTAEAAVRDGDGTTWALCVEDRAVRLARGSGGGWESVGGSAAEVPRDVASITTLLPPL